MRSLSRYAGCALLALLFWMHGPVWAQSTGEYVGHDVRGSTVVVEGDSATAHLTFQAPDVVRVDWTAPGAARPDSSVAVVQEDGATPPTVRDREDALWVRSEALAVQVQKAPLQLRFTEADGTPLTRESTRYTRNDDGHRLGFHLDDDTHVYGTGERAGSLNLRGKAFDLYNTQQYGYQEAPSQMKVNVPLAVTSGGYGLYVDTTWPTRFDIGAADSNTFSVDVEGGALTYYLMAAPDIPAQLEQYTALTGRQPMPPKWALGYIQSKYGYRTEDDARAIVDELRENDIPIDALILDLYWFEHMGDLRWNRERFPEPFQMMRDLRADGVETIAITEPFLVPESGLFDQGAQAGYFAQDETGDPYLIDDWWSCTESVAESDEGCQAALVDLTNPAARAWWWGQYPVFMGEEMGGLWTDLGEPEEHPEGMQHYNGSVASVHNAYNLLWAKTLFDGYRDWRPNQRLVNLTRAGSAGMQRYSTFLWSGDVGRSFTGLQSQPPMLLNMSLSGLAYYSSDLGGFTNGTTTDELYTRWLQHGAFTPTMRPHGVDDQATEPTRFSDETLSIVRDYVQLRYRLMPYLYTLAHENHTTGMPLTRPLFFADADNPALANYDDAYLFGDAFLVAPVMTEGQREKTVELPQGAWIHYWSGDAYAGGQSVTVDAPLDEMPLFVRAGSIIPMRPVAPHTGAQPQDELHLDVYPGPDTRHSASLYEDDGSTLAYDEGAYATTALHQTRHTVDGAPVLDLTVEAATGSYDGQPTTRTLAPTVHRLADAPTAVTHNSTDLPQRDSAEEVAENGGFHYDADTQQLHVQIMDASLDTAHTLRIQNAEVASLP